MNSDFDLYEVLEVSIQSNSAEIKKSYKKLALKYHPDRPTGDTEKFKQIALAYEILSDPQKKREYDQLKRRTTSTRRKQKSQQHSPGFPDMQPDPNLNAFYQRHSTSFFNPFSIFQDIFGEFLNFMVAEHFPIEDMDFENRSILDDIDALEELYMANMGTMSGAPLAPIIFSTNIQSRRLEPIFETAQRTVEFLHSQILPALQTPQAQQTYFVPDSEYKNPMESSNPLPKTRETQDPQGKFQEKTFEPKAKMESQVKEKPKDLVQTIKVNLLDIYQNKTKRFNLTRLRRSERNGKTVTKEKTTIEIPLIHKQIKISGQGDWLSTWEKPGDVLINVIAKKGKFLRINDSDILTYHQITLVEWYQGFTIIDFLDGTQLQLPLDHKGLKDSNMLIKVPNRGLPKDTQVKMRGSLYVQVVILPPNPGDLEAEDVPQLIRILGSSKDFSKNVENNPQNEPIIVNNVETVPGLSLDFVNYDDE